MEIDSRTGLVLEGGGMRAIFTVGVLDCFMDHEIWFPYTIGVSAGASNGISYASRQRGRSRFSNIDLLEKYDYIGFRHFLRGRGYIDMKYLFYICNSSYNAIHISLRSAADGGTPFLKHRYIAYFNYRIFCFFQNYSELFGIYFAKTYFSSRF